MQAAVDAPHKHERAEPADGTQHDEEEVADDGHVAKVERALQEAGHVRVIVKVEEGVAVDEEARGATVEEGVPPPPIVLHAQLEVGECNRDARRDDEQNDEHEAEDAKQLIGTAAPHAVEDVEQFNVDGAERQESRHQHLIRQLAVPRNRWDFAREVLGAHGRVEGRCESLASNTTEEGERQTHEHPNREHGEDGGERERRRDAVVRGHNVEEGDHAEDGQAKDGGGEQHDPGPLGLRGAGTARGLHADVETCRDKASDTSCERVEDNGRDLQGTVVARVVNADHGEEERERGHGDELRANTDEGTQPELRGVSILEINIVGRVSREGPHLPCWAGSGRHRRESTSSRSLQRRCPLLRRAHSGCNRSSRCA